MNRLICACVLVLLWTAGPAVAADQVFRCTNAQGVAVFSEIPCGPDAQVETYDSPRSQDAASPTAIDQLNRYRDSVRDIDRLIGREQRPAAATRPREQDQDTCRQVASLKLRNARVARRVIMCHSKSDVRAIHGEPDVVENWSDRKAYDTRWTYHASYDDPLTTYIYFKDGLVSKWSTRQRSD
jgi:hypothetical protein